MILSHKQHRTEQGFFVNKTWDTKEFIDGVKGANVWAQGAKTFLKSALVAIALSSSPSLAESPQYDKGNSEPAITAPKMINFNKLDYSQYVQGDTLRTLEGAGYADVAIHRRSGVYEHPDLPGQMVTLKFAEDPDADKRIQADLAVLYGDDLGYRWQNNLSRMMFGFGAHDASAQGRSFHIQDPFNIGQDVNFIYMRDNDVKKNLVIKGIDSLNAEQLTTYSAIRLIEHEIAHSLPHQQMSFAQLATSPFNTDFIRSLEVSAEFIAEIAVLQQMKKDGVDNDTIRKYLEFHDDRNWQNLGNEKTSDMHYESVNNDVMMDKMDINSRVTHPVFISTAALLHLFKENPDSVLSLTRDDVEKLAAKLMDQVHKHDFSEDVKLQVDANLLNPENQEKIELITAVLLQSDRAYRNGESSEYERVISQLKQSDSEMEKSLASYLEQHRDDFGKLAKDDLKTMVENAYRDAKLSPLSNSRINGLSTEGQLLLGKTGRLELLALDQVYRDQFVRDILNKYPHYIPNTPVTNIQQRVVESGVDKVLQKGLDITPSQLALLNELDGLRDSARPGQLAVDMQRALQETNPNIPEDTWKVIANGLREQKSIKDILDDVNKHAQDEATVQYTANPVPAFSPEDYVIEGYENRPRPGFAPRPGSR